ncbi:hypothetical protein NUM3379_29570 [Kineococcus sp. NUM-3379]
MTWPQAVPAVLLGTAVLLLPGAVVGWALRQRGLALLGAAPGLSTAVVALAALLAPRAGLPWGPLPVLAATAAAALAGAGASLLLRAADRPGAGAARPARAGEPAQAPARGAAAEGPDDRAALAAGIAGLLVALVLAAASTARGLGRPDAVSQTFDAMFHLNAVQRVVDTADASPLSVAQLTSPFSDSAYYPAAWHAVAGLLAQTGVPVVVSANVLVLLIAGLVWPLGCVLLVRRLVGPRPVPLLLAGVLSQGFVAFPWLIDRWGALWPQTLGTALLPAALGALLHATAPAPAAAHATAAPVPAGDRLRSLLVAAAVALAVVLAHPGSFLLGLLLAAALVLVTALPQALLPWRARPAQWRALAGAAAGVLAAAGALAVLSPRLRNMTAADWPATRTLGEAALEELLHAPAGAAVNVVVAVLVVVGLVVAAARPRWRWLVAGHLLLAALDVVAAGTDAPFAQVVTGPWYNDRFRLAAAVPVTGAALAVLGAVALAGRAAGAGGAGRTGAHRAGGRRAVPVLAVVLALAAAVPAVRGNGDQLGATNARAERHPVLSLVSPQEQRFLEGLRRHVPPGWVVAGTPWDGSAYLYALSGGVEALYPHMRGNLGEDARFLADHLQDAATDPAVCPLLQARRVRYVLDMGPLWDPPGLDPAGYTAFRLFRERPGFTPVASGGGARLYEITACDWKG